MNLDLKRYESLLLIDGLNIRITQVETLLNGLSNQYLIDEYTNELNELKELQLKLTIATNKEYFQTN